MHSTGWSIILYIELSRYNKCYSIQCVCKVCITFFDLSVCVCTTTVVPVCCTGRVKTVDRDRSSATRTKIQLTPRFRWHATTRSKAQSTDVEDGSITFVFATAYLGSISSSKAQSLHPCGSIGTFVILLASFNDWFLVHVV